ICMLLRAFGFYLSSYITVVIAIDRYMSIVHPLVFHGSFKRCKFMLASAYVISFFFSLPQSIIFHVEYHPVYSWFSQCVTFNFFESDFHELAYDIFSCAAVYVTPLFIMVVMYTRIFVKLSHQQYKHEVRPMLSSRHLRRWKHNCLPIHTQLRCSRANYLYKAKLRTLKMTLCIVCVFILCWTPYFFMILYHWLAKDVAVQMDSKIKRVLFIFAVSSSCLDPLVY
ncbi:gonadotropin-releasing hormone receptor, partial [Biomphalaria glabrata]